MEFELVWLLALPLFFLLGWFAARHESRSARSGDEMPAAYFRGLNFLLNEQPDRAIDAFVDVVRFDPETVELHFALAKLFRQRGENDRAIRIHQNLVDRDGLDRAAREQALFELGLDFLKAGLLDRAEQAFVKLEGTSRAANALRHRLEIAQLVRDWPLAIELAGRLPAADSDAAPAARQALIHFHCELAAKALAGSSPDGRAQARQHLEDAARIMPRHPRVALMRAEMAMAGGDVAGALAVWDDLRREQPGWFVLGVRQWLAARQSIGEGDQALEALDEQIAAQRSTDILLTVLDARIARDGREAAVIWAREALRKVPSLAGLDRLLALELASPRAELNREDLELTRRLLHPQAQRQSRYVCAHCGFKARDYSWQCPGCGHWESCAPQRAETLTQS